MSIQSVSSIAVTLMIFTCPFSAPAPCSQPAAAARAWTGDMLVFGNVTYSNESITLSGNLTITGSLTLDGVDLRLDSPSNGSFRIEVRNGGAFNMLAKTKIHSTDPDRHFYFDVRMGATLNMDSSELHDCGWDFNGEYGLLIESSQVSITNSTLTDNCEGLIVDAGASPFIHKNNISANSYNGIEVLNGSAPVIDSNNISGNVRRGQPGYYGNVAGILSRASSPVITNNSISDNKAYGISLLTSGSPVVMYNRIAGHRALDEWSRGIYLENCDAYIGANNITQNAGGMCIGHGTSTVENNVLDNNTYAGATDSSALLDYSQSTYRNNTYSRSARGAFMADGSLATFENETFINCTSAGVYGLSMGMPEYNVVMTNCTFAGNRWDVWLDWLQFIAMGGNLMLVNPSYNPNLVNFQDPCGALTVKWYLRAQAVYENGSRPAEGANVKVTDSAGVKAAELETGRDGWTRMVPLEEYVKDGPTMRTLWPYNVSARMGEKASFTAGVELTSSRDIKVVLDDVPPFLRITGPADGSFTNATSLTVTGRTEPGAILTVNDGPVPVSRDGGWSASIELRDEGANQITALAEDRCQNLARAEIAVFRDTVAPVVTLASPKNGFLVNRSAVLVAGKVSEPDGETTANWEKVAVGPDGSFRFELNLTEGTNTIQVACRDRARNTGTATVIGELDTLPPNLGISEPKSGLATNASSVTIKGTAEAKCSLTINGRAVSMQGGSFSAAVDLEEGPNSFIVAARDRAGNVDTASLRIVRDSIAPPLVILSPREGERLNRTSVELRGTTEAGAIVKVDGVRLDFQGAEFSTQMELPNEGANTFLIEASDSVRNSVRLALTVHRDTLPPALKLRTPADGSLTNQTAIVLGGKTEPGAELTVNGRKVDIERDGAFSTVVEIGQEGANRISVVARDGAGNAVAAGLTVFRDTVLFYNITSPRDGARVCSKNITAAGNAEPGATVTIQGKVAALRSDGSFTADVLLTDGPNRISVAIKDRAGNNATVVLTVYKETPAEPTKGFLPGFEGLLLLAALAAVPFLYRKEY